MTTLTTPRRDEKYVDPDPVVRAFTAVYHFLASLKLAVFSLATLAAVLAYATFFESWYGTAAVQEWIYKSPGFAILLAFLGMNILCAALIRYPWKRRQTGFVITHAGLLTVLAGSFITLTLADEGQVALLEGEKTSTLARIDYPTIRVRPLNPETGEPESEYSLPFRPTTFNWFAGRPRPRGFFKNIANTLTFGLFDNFDPKVDVLTPPKASFKFAVKAHYPASEPRFVHTEVEGGAAMIKASLMIKPPGAITAMDALEDPADSWVVADRRFYRASKNVGMAMFAFQYVDSDEKVNEFLSPVENPGPQGTARISYRDSSGKPRVFDWRLGDPAFEAPKRLPDSDLTITSVVAETFPSDSLPGGSRENLMEVTGERDLDLVIVKIRRGDGPEIVHYGWLMLPMVPNVIPGRDGSNVEPLARVTFHRSPIDPTRTRRLGFVEVIGTPKGKLYYRVFTRSGIKGLSELKLGESVQVLGGDKSPMSGVLRVDKYLPEGKEELIYAPLDLPKGQKGNGIPAALVEMTVGHDKKEFWLRRNGDIDPVYKTVLIGDKPYQVAYDFDRRDLDFDLKLVNFEVGFDPGTRQASSFVSDVLLTDKRQKIDEKPITISMNRPMVNRGWTFYQSNYQEVRDPKTDQKTGEFKSVFQVGYDPGRVLKYLGCVMVACGAFVQFYMRAGIFTDGGKRERVKLEAKLKRLELKSNAGGARSRGRARP